MPQDSRNSFCARAKSYSRIKYSLSLFGTLYLIALLFAFIGCGLSQALAEQIASAVRNRYLASALYLLAIFIAYRLLNFPLDFYSSYRLEHKFSLSNQGIGDWLLDQFKSGAVFYLVSLIALWAFYYILKASPHRWWIWIWLFWIFFTLLLARLAPLVIIPLFFKYKKISDQDLRRRILGLAERMKVKILDLFEIDFSKKTLKANAALAGMGRTRRVILADTLKDKYTPAEIEVILAHEFAHYKLRHIPKLIFLNSLASLACFYLIYKTSAYTLGLCGFHSLSQPAALPLLVIYFVLFGIVSQPLANGLSRRMEKNADLLALKVTGDKNSFISLMDKLAGQNLADRKPHPLVKFFFFDHPPIDERIASAK